MHSTNVVGTRKVVPVESIIPHSGYSSNSMTNDIAVMSKCFGKLKFTKASIGPMSSLQRKETKLKRAYGKSYLNYVYTVSYLFTLITINYIFILFVVSKSLTAI